MFDLEKSTAEWRKQMLGVGIKTPVPLEELESHLREAVEQRLKSGLDEEMAFKISVQEMGPSNVLESEFKKNERISMKTAIRFLIGFVGVAVGMAIVMPAVAAHRAMGVWNSNIIWPIAIGSAIVVGGLALAIFVMKNPLVTLVGAVLALFGTTMILPALGKHYHQGRPWSNQDILCGMVIGMIITLIGIGTVIAGFIKRKA